MNLFDLPDEILSIIWKQFKQIEVFHSIIYMHHRLRELAFDHVHIRNLNFSYMPNMILWDNTRLSTNVESASRFCKEMVSRIHSLVQKLTIDQCFTKEILCRNYSQLHSLSLVNFDEKILDQYIKNGEVIRSILIKQITHLQIDMRKPRNWLFEIVANIFVLFVLLCENLVEFNFGDMYLTRKYFISVYCASLLNNCVSSTLVKLQINVFDIVDIFILLDGRFKSLTTLNVTIESIRREVSRSYNNTGEKLTKLKWFSLTVLRKMSCFNSAIVPLLCRMINLEELRLYLTELRYHPRFIDAHELFDEFIVHLTKLQKFTFNIKTKLMDSENLFKLPTSQDMERSFLEKFNLNVVSSITINLPEKNGTCHIYTMPYDFEYFYELDNCFQGGIFRRVRYLTMVDTSSFGYELFSIVSQAFPLLQFLILTNEDPVTQITFPHLVLLDLKFAHVDYAELFLTKKTMNLPCLSNLIIEYDLLSKITNEFTRNSTNFNFETLKNLGVTATSKMFDEYFSFLRVVWL